MRKLVALMLALMLTLGGLSLAVAEDVDYKALIAEKDKQIEELQNQVEALTAALNKKTAESEPEASTTLTTGSKGEAVKKLQTRLKELGYLSGSADGSYGKGTASAVSMFQSQAGLSQTGEVDATTQEALYSENAPKSPEALYEKLDYKTNARDPESYKGTKIKFTGKIVQVMEDEGYAAFRIATKGSYDNIVYGIYEIPDGYKRFLEDDKVTVYATSLGVYTYETVMGGEVTIPACQIETITLQ